jgi:hypothetical protein
MWGDHPVIQIESAYTLTDPHDCANDFVAKHQSRGVTTVVQLEQVGSTKTAAFES